MCAKKTKILFTFEDLKKKKKSRQRLSQVQHLKAVPPTASQATVWGKVPPRQAPPPLPLLLSPCQCEWTFNDLAGHSIEWKMCRSVERGSTCRSKQRAWLCIHTSGGEGCGGFTHQAWGEAKNTHTHTHSVHGPQSFSHALRRICHNESLPRCSVVKGISECDSRVVIVTAQHNFCPSNPSHLPISAQLTTRTTGFGCWKPAHMSSIQTHPFMSQRSFAGQLSPVINRTAPRSCRGRAANSSSNGGDRKRNPPSAYRRSEGRPEQFAKVTSTHYIRCAGRKEAM